MDIIRQRSERLESLYLDERQTVESDILSTEGLLDTVSALWTEGFGLKRERNIATFLERNKDAMNQVQSLRLKCEDFEVLRTIGRGAFGEVQLVRMKDSNQVFAMKKLNKWDMLKRQETACFKEERDVLVQGDKKWITELHYAFQDHDFLYLVMEYYIGGDLLTLMARFEDRLEESMARFYLAEILMAIDCVHKIGYLHRDIKPDNILLDRCGHVHLADFGSCLKLDAHGKVSSTVAVGTPDYISPEILCAMDDGKGSYGVECDWWSYGIVVYEILFGETPFYAESLVDTYSQIMHHKERFSFPEDVGTDEVSEEARDLIQKLICEPEERLGTHGADDIKTHPFFAEIDWATLHTSAPPYVPEVGHETDTSNFDEIDEPPAEHTQPPVSGHFAGIHLPFVGFTFTRDTMFNDICSRREVPNGVPLKVSSSNVAPSSSLIKSMEEERNALQEEMKKILQEAKDRQRSYEERLQTQYVACSDLEQRLQSTEQTLARMVQDNELLSSDLELAREEAQAQEQELQTLRRNVTTETNEKNEELNTLKAANAKLKLSLREAEEEAEKATSKVDSLKTDITKLEKAKREIVLELDSMEAALALEQKAKARLQSDLKEAQDAMEEHAESGADSVKTLKDDVIRLKGLLESAHGELDEALARVEKERRALAQDHAEKEAKFESTMRDYNSEVEELKKKLANQVASTQEACSVEWEEKLSSLRCKLEGELAQTAMENTNLQSQVEKLTSVVERQRCNRGDNDENSDLRTWFEGQVDGIHKSMSEESDARTYLRTVAGSITEQVESLKRVCQEHMAASKEMESGLLSLPVSHLLDSQTVAEEPEVTTGAPSVSASILKNPAKSVKRDWQARRSIRHGKQEYLVLQNSLKNEIEAKNALANELSTMRAQMEAMETQLKEMADEVDIVSQERDAHQAELSRLRDDRPGALSRRTSSEMSINTALLLHDSMNPTDSSFSIQKSPSTQGSLMLKRSDSSRSRISATSKDAELFEEKPLAVIPKTSLSPSPLEKKAKAHRFVIKSVPSPTKCHYCKGILIGLMRQCVECKECSYLVHTSCTRDMKVTCPYNPEQDASKVGAKTAPYTAAVIEGFVKIPKPGGVKRGWTRHFVTVSEFKVIFYSLASEHIPTNNVTNVIDLRDTSTTVSCVTQADVIHAPSRILASILRITMSVHESEHPEESPSRGGEGDESCEPISTHMLMCFDNDKLKQRWLFTLTSLLQLIRTSVTVHRPERISLLPVLASRQLDCLRSHSPVALEILDFSHIAVATDEGLFLVDLAESVVMTVYDKKVSAVTAVPSNEYIAAIVGKNHQLRVYSYSALDSGECESSCIKIQDTKGCAHLCAGTMPNGSTFICTTIKRKALVFLVIVNDEGLYQLSKHREISLTHTPQVLNACHGAFVVGMGNDFWLFNLTTERCTPRRLVDPTDPSLQFVNTHANVLQPVRCIEMTAMSEYLLIYNTIGVFVSTDGKRTRKRDLIFPAPPVTISYQAPLLSVTTNHCVDTFDLTKLDWIQSTPLPTAIFLSSGNLLWSPSTEPARLLYHKSPFHEKCIMDLSDDATIVSVKANKKSTSKKKASSGGWKK
ncbi:serine/threonine-protein kinase MRCK alpha-like [Sycon ciliatum]|uniref:serine/threonine-protein kinase MRCK alpha-like n=2 Tax=Sycon ciliatum TaxID=27933 RepID=UPI0031F61DA4